MEVSFYQVTTTPTEKTVPKLLEKAYSANQRVVVLVDSQERLDLFNSVLWTYSTAAFLPHGSSQDAPETHSRQPIWLTTTVENPNQSQLIVVTSGVTIDAQSGFDRCIDIFDGNIPDLLAGAKARYKIYKDQGLTCVYWRQNLEGGWAQE